MTYKNIDFSDLSQLTNSLLRTMHPRIKRFLKYGNLTEQHISVVNGIDGEYVLPNATISEMMQGWQKAFVRKGQIGFDAEKIHVRRSMINWGFFPQEHYEKWYSKLERTNIQRERAGQRPLTSMEFPLQQYLVDLIQTQLIHEEESLVAFQGVFKDPVTDVPGRAKYTIDGVYTVVKRLIKEGKIIPLLVDTFTDADTLDFIDEFIDMVDEIYQMQSMKLFTGVRARRKYSKNYKDANADSIEERRGNDVRFPIYVEDSNTEVVGFPNLAGIKTMILTPMENIVKVWSEFMNPLNIKVPIKEHLVLGDWGRGYGIGLPGICFVAGEIIEPPTVVATTPAADSVAVKIEEVPEATGYRVDIATDSGFTNLVVTNAAFSSADPTQENFTLKDGAVSFQWNVNETVAGLNASTPYYVRVRAELTVADGENQGTTYTSQNSKTATFTTTA